MEADVVNSIYVLAMSHTIERGGRGGDTQKIGCCTLGIQECPQSHGQVWTRASLKVHSNPDCVPWDPIAPQQPPPRPVARSAQSRLQRHSSHRSSAAALCAFCSAAAGQLHRADTSLREIDLVQEYRLHCCTLHHLTKRTPDAGCTRAAPSCSWKPQLQESATLKLPP